MYKNLIALLLIGVAGVFIWQTTPDQQAATVPPSVVDAPGQPVVLPALREHDNFTRKQSLETVAMVPEPPAEARYIPEVLHNPVVPVEKPYVRLTETEKKRLTQKRDRAAEGIQQAMLEYDNYLDDPVKRAEIQASVQDERDAYKQAMIRLAKEDLKEQARQ